MPVRRTSRAVRSSPSSFTRPTPDTSGRRNPANPLSRACAPVLEALEPRRLLTTVLPNETFEFADAEGNIVRVRVEGNMIVELIGSVVDDTNTATLVELPGRITVSDTRPGTNLFGGIGGGTGVQVIGNTTITDSINGAGGTVPTVPSDAVNFDAIASNAAGQTWGLNLLTVVTGNTQNKVVQLAQLSNSTGAATVAHSIEASLPLDTTSGQSTVTDIRAADFGPDGLLYFVAVGGVGGTAGEVPRLFRVDVGTGVVTQIPGTFGVANGGTAIDIESISFNNSGTLFGYGVRDGSGVFFTIPTGNTDGTGGFTAVQLFNTETDEIENVENITAIEFVPGVNGSFYAVQNAGDESRLLLVNVATGSATVLGRLPELGEDETGEDIQGLTWNPTLTDPFTNTLGVLLATDVGTDELLFIDRRQRVEEANIYQIFVVQSDADARLSIGALAVTLDQVKAAGIGVTADKPMVPFSGNAGSIRVTDAQEGNSILVNSPGNSGEVFIGARTIDLSDQDEEDDLIPILSVTNPNTFANLPAGFDQIPGSGLQLRPGVHVIDGIDVGRILIGGTVTGNVYLGGSADGFYAGWLPLGATDGQFEGDAEVPGNFSVVGDIRNILSKGSIGTDAITGALNAPHYVTGFDLQVGGRLGQVRTGDKLIGYINVYGSSAPRMDDQLEVENRLPTEQAVSAFENGEFGSDTFFNNDTFDTPQRLGAIEQDGEQVVNVLGSLNGDAGFDDEADYYSVALMAGQTVTVQLTPTNSDTNLSLLVFDPDGRLIVSDYEDKFNALQFTVDRPGEYRFAVTFQGIELPVDVVSSTLINLFDTPYRLTITGVGNLFLGGVVADDDAFLMAPDSDIAAWRLRRGDFGAVSVGGTLLSGSSIFPAVQSDAGDLRSIDAAAIGAPDETNDSGGQILGNSVGHAVPFGNVGLIRASGIVSIMTTEPVNFPGLDDAIGGNYQLIDAGGSFGGSVRANKAIGVIRAASTGAPTIDVNADGLG
ncbi:MAG: hypothetical protein ACREIT_03775, partial [Tepidisphaeraceae bacterium]